MSRGLERITAMWTTLVVTIATVVMGFATLGLATVFLQSSTDGVLFCIAVPAAVIAVPSLLAALRLGARMKDGAEAIYVGAPRSAAR